MVQIKRKVVCFQTVNKGQFEDGPHFGIDMAWLARVEKYDSFWWYKKRKQLKLAYFDIFKTDPLVLKAFFVPAS